MYDIRSRAGISLCTAALFVMMAVPAHAALLLYDDMSDYAATSNLDGQGLWTKGGSGPSCTVQNAAPLTYAGYEGGGGNYVQMPSASSTASRIYRGFTEVAMPGNTVYVAFLLRLSSATETGDYFLSLGNSGAGTIYTPRLFAKSSGAGYQLGIGKAVAVGSAVWDETVYSFDTTYLVVIRLDGITGTANDALYLWVNPSLDSEPSTASAGAATTSDGDPSALGNFHWHNRTTSNPSGAFDAVRVAAAVTSAAAWTDLGAKFSTPTITVQGGTLAFGNTAVGNISSEQSYTVSGVNLTANMAVSAPSGFEISTTSGSGFDTSLNLAHTDGSVSETTIYARFEPSAAQNYSTDITHASSGATTGNKSVTGNGVLSAPSDLRASETNVNNFEASWNVVTGADGYRLDVATRGEFLPAGSTLVTNGFEGSWPPAGWTTNAVDQVTNIKHSDSYSAFLNAVGDYLITPLIDRPAELRFWSYTTADNPTVVVATSTNIAGPWTISPDGQFSGDTLQWNERVVELGNSAGVYVRFTKSGTGNLYLDDVHIVSTVADFVPGYDDRTVTDGSTLLASVTGLVSYTEYFYRVRAAGNTTVSGNSSTQSVTTLVMPAPGSVWTSVTGALDFVANWSVVTEATGYRLDVSTNDAFATFVEGYANLDVGGVTSITVTDLEAQTMYYYRVRAYDAGAPSANSATQSVTTTLKPEPTSHATGFSAPTVTHRSIILTWTDAGGTIPPDRYLVRGSTNGYDAIPTPTDSIYVVNNTDWVGGLYANNVKQGVQKDDLRGLPSDRTYYFKLFPYANSHSKIDYKTNSPVPELMVTTGPAPLEDFEDRTVQSPSNGVVNLKSGAWLFNDTLLGTLASDKRLDQRAARIQGSGFLEMQFDVSYVQTVSVEHANFSDDSDGSFVMQVSTNGGTSWQQIGGTVNCSKDLQTAVFTVHQKGNVRFRIEKTGGNRINIDNVRITPFRLPPSVFRFN